MTTDLNDDPFYSQGEFECAFNEFLIFLKSPQTSLETFESIRAQGQKKAAQKIYEMANRYKWLNWIIDRRTAVVHDMALIAVFVGCETEAIVKNWTGVSLAEKGKIWLRTKIQQRQQALQEQQGKRKGWGFLARRGAEKPQKPESLPENSQE